MSRVFMIADTHFGDNGSIIKYEGRPFKDGEEMNERLIENWNRVVGEDDTVYHLGDFALNPTEEEAAALLRRLNGKKILIVGNHDTGLTVKEWLDCGFEAVCPLPVIFEGFYMLSHEPLYVNTASPYANIFGHVHKNPAYRDHSARSFCACVERTGYAPVAFDVIREAILRDAEAAGHGEAE